MTKLHEILPVEGDKHAIATKILEEASVTFLKRREHFIGIVSNTIFLDESRQGENVRDTKPMVTTVLDKLKYVSSFLVNYWDLLIQKEKANQAAVADLMVDGVTLIEKAPATWLLGMETRLKAVREVLINIPTHDPAMRWQPKLDAGEGVFTNADSDVRFRTEKVKEFHVVVQATDKFPAQVMESTKDVQVARIEKSHFPDMLTPAHKSEILGNIDRLIEAVKKARQRANNVEVPKLKAGEVLWNFILKVNTDQE